MKQTWYTSKGIWGGVLMIISLLLQVTGVADITPDEQTALTDNLVNVAAVVGEVVGLVLSIWGRITAKKPIGLGGSSGTTVNDLGIAVILILVTVGYAVGWVNHTNKSAPAPCKAECSAKAIDMHLVNGVYSALPPVLEVAELPEL